MNVNSTQHTNFNVFESGIRDITHMPLSELQKDLNNLYIWKTRIPDQYGIIHSGVVWASNIIHAHNLVVAEFSNLAVFNDQCINDTIDSLEILQVNLFEQVCEGHRSV